MIPRRLPLRSVDLPDARRIHALLNRTYFRLTGEASVESQSRLGTYEILEPLGKGGMGEVYRARDTELRRDVAIKLLPERLADDRERLDRLKREARSLAALNHPHIATVHGFERIDDTSFIVMELVHGETLTARLERQPPDVPEALELAVQVARALEAAHRNDIVHRDLKPDNVKITPAGIVKVLDFGLAKRLRDDASGPAGARLATATVQPTQTGAIMGTPPYMSPEQIRGASVDERADIWAFGCLLYEILVTKRAFHRETHSDTLAAILTEDPDWRVLPAPTPDPVRDVLRRCLRKDPERRLHHIADARIEIEEALEELSRPAAATDTPARDVKAGMQGRTGTLPGGRHVPPAVAAVLGLLFLTMVATVTFYLIERTGSAGERDRSIAVLPFDRLGRATDAEAFVEGIHDGVLTELSRISDLTVISRTSVLQYAETTEDIPSIARQLGVASILEGTVQRSGNRVRVAVQLVDGRSDVRLWADTYDRELTARNVFEIQSDLARDIAGQLQARLTPAEERRVERTPTDDLAAYRLYVQGRTLLNQRSPDDMRLAVDFFERTIEQDPDYALAWAGLADGMLLLESFGHVEPGSLVPRAREAVDNALRLDAELGEPHGSLALLHYLDRDIPQAIEELGRALELRPSYAEAHNLRSYFHSLGGDPAEALASAVRAVELNPLSAGAYSNLALSRLLTGDREGALRAARRTQQMQPDYPSGRLYEALPLYHMGRVQQAADVLRDLVVPWAGSGPLAMMALAQVSLGNPERARELLASLRVADEHFNVGLVNAALGDVDAALDTFEAIEVWEDWPTLTLRYFFPDVLAPVREHPRYQDLVRVVDRSWGIPSATADR